MNKDAVLGDRLRLAAERVSKSNVFQAQECYKEGTNFMNKGFYQEALSRFIQAISLSPATSKYYFARGICMYKMKEVESAVSEFTTAIQLESSFPEYFSYRSDAFKKLGRLEDASQDLSSAITLSPTDWELFYKKGSIEFERKSFALAIEAYTKALSFCEPEKSYRILIKRALSYRHLMDHQSSLYDFQKASEMDPKNHAGALQLGITYFLMNRYTEAVFQFSHAIKLSSSDASCFSNRALAYFKLGVYDNALRDVEMALDLRPHHNLIYQRGLIRFAQQLYDSAIRDFEEAIQMQHDNPVYHRTCALAYMEKNDFDKALRAFELAIDVDPSDATAHYYVGIIRHQQLQLNVAIYSFTRMIEHSPDHYLGYKARGAASLDLFKFDAAKSDLDKAISINSKSYACFLIRGCIHHHLGKLKEALLDFDAASKLNPTDPKIWRHRSTVCRSLKKYDDAISDIARAVYLVQSQAEQPRLPSSSSKQDFNQELVSDKHENVHSALVLSSYHSSFPTTSRLVSSVLASMLDGFKNLSENEEEECLLVRSQLHCEMKQFSEAIADLSRCLQIRMNLRVVFNRGLAYYSMQSFSLALADFNTLIQNKPLWDPSYYYAGLCHLKLREIERAIQVFDKAIDSKIVPEYIHERAKAYQKLGKNSEALLDFNRFLLLVPDNTNALFRRGFCHLALGKAA
eukprot:TRINITY_DN5833_c0_g1_i5.p1 TRINITY_DN5833_c0_g1~~TRINITY_DN5833_c0_g1_i5.p1  ORF type:complete len:687 (-),score=117.54 TRINITY_DN5833_c0_g1_i5:533-2593(-)